jgi:hypothetical protein
MTKKYVRGSDVWHFAESRDCGQCGCIAMPILHTMTVCQIGIPTRVWRDAPIDAKPVCAYCQAGTPAPTPSRLPPHA